MSDTKVKGSGIKPSLEWIRATHGEDLYREILGELPEEDRRAIEMLNTGMAYPIELYDHILVTFARLKFGEDRMAAEREFRAMGAAAAAAGLSGIYSAFLKISSPGGTFKRAASMLTMLYVGVNGESTIAEEGDMVRATLTITGLGDLSYTGPRLCGFGEEALSRTGLVNPRIEERGWNAGRIKADPLVFETSWPKG